MAEGTPSFHETNQHRFKTLNEYFAWAGENWIHEFGSDEAQKHARSKLGEEVEELSDALETGAPDEIKAELGDVLWTANAVAMNEGFKVRSEPVSLEDLDERALRDDTEWDVPVLRALYNLSPEEINSRLLSGDVKTTKMVLESLAHQLGKAAKITRAITPELDLSPKAKRTFLVNGWLEVQYGRVIWAVDQIDLLVSLIAQRRLGISIADVMQDNYEKLTSRIAQGDPVTK
jgi:NTP pyrophosphatase (non-canonical NTP hydrolase)